ncbi:hypothetical protein LINPERPRIM_LOCUS15451 [Linum perenne]
MTSPLSSLMSMKYKGQGNKAAKGPAQKKQQPPPPDGCFFCLKLGHMKKDCTDYHAWRAKKGLPELPKAK